MEGTPWPFAGCSPLAQRQSVRLLTEMLVVRIHHGEPKFNPLISAVLIKCETPWGDLPRGFVVSGVPTPTYAFLPSSTFRTPHPVGICRKPGRGALAMAGVAVRCRLIETSSGIGRVNGGV